MIPHKTVWAATVLAALLVVVGSGHAQTVIQVAGGQGHTLLLKSDGSLWAMGDNTYGQLGDGTYSSTNQPKRIVASQVTAIAAGYAHSLFLKSDGSLWAMGKNTYGQLGDGTAMNAVSGYYGQTNVPERIVASNVTAIAAGYAHSLFLKRDGSLWAMGNAAQGQLGATNFGDINRDTNNPELIVASNVTAVAAGDYFSLFTESDGSVWAMGNNHYGQLGYGLISDLSHPAYPVQIVASNVTAIAAGGRHSLLLKGDGSVWAMGNNEFGQLGDGTYNDSTYYLTNRPKEIVASNVVAIAGGTEHSLLLKNDGSLWAMGHNQCGQLGYGPTVGAGNCTNLPELIVPNGVMALASRVAFSSFFLKSAGSLWAMGQNAHGELGDGTGNINGTNQPEQIVSGSLTAGGGSFANQQFRFTLTGPAGSNAVIAASTNLINWTPLVTNPLGSGSLSFTDAVSTNFPRRFYRAALTP